MLPPSGGDPTRRMAHFLRPSVASGSVLPPPPLSSPIPALESHEWATKISFHGWSCKEKQWKKWVDSLHSLHQFVWRTAGIYEAIMASTYQIQRNDDLVYGVAAKWCSETNTFVFPWGEATITLEDVMILGGFSVLGESVSAALEEKELEEIKENLIQERRLISRSSTAQKKACQSVWMDRFMGSGSQLEHEAFLSLWLSRFVLPVKPDSTIEKHVFSVAVRLARGIQVALAPSVLSSIYRDLSLLREVLVTLSKKENFQGVSLLAPLQFVQVWVWERFPALRPSPEPIQFGEPRVARWHKTRGCRVENVGVALDTAGASFQWRPYVRAVNNWDFPGFYREREEWVSMDSNFDQNLLAFARFLRVSKLVGVDDCMEWYFPHRVAMQFGMDQDLPGCVHECAESPEIAWRSYSEPFNGILYFPSRLFDSDVTSRYLYWWQSSVVQKAAANGVPNPSCFSATKVSSIQEAPAHPIQGFKPGVDKVLQDLSGLRSKIKARKEEKIIEMEKREEDKPSYRQLKVKLKLRRVKNTEAPETASKDPSVGNSGKRKVGELRYTSPIGKKRPASSSPTGVQQGKEKRANVPVQSSSAMVMWDDHSVPATEVPSTRTKNEENVSDSASTSKDGKAVSSPPSLEAILANHIPAFTAEDLTSLGRIFGGSEVEKVARFISGVRPEELLPLVTRLPPNHDSIIHHISYFICLILGPVHLGSTIL